MSTINISSMSDYGRKRSRWAKRTNVEIVVQEKAEKKTNKEKIEAKNVKSDKKLPKTNEYKTSDQELKEPKNKK